MERNDQPTLHRRGRLISDTLAAKWIELVTQALLVLVVPRALGPAAYGEFVVAFAMVSVVSLGLGLGAPLAAVRYLPAAEPELRAGQARALAAELVRSRARILGALSLAALALAPELLEVSRGITAAVCLAACFSVGSTIAAELALSLQMTRVWNARFPLENGLVVVGAPIGYAISGADGAIAGLLVATGLTLALLLRPLAGELHGSFRGTVLSPEAMRYARMQTGSAILGTLITRGGTLAMPLAGASSTQVGFAALATGVGAAGATTMMSLLIVQLPGLVGRSASEAERDAARTARVALAVALVTALPAAVLALPAIDLLLGAEFAGAREPVVLALPSVPLGAALGLAWLLAALRLRPAALTVSWAAGGVSFALLAATVIPALDADGASIAMTGGLLVAALAATVLIGGRALQATCAAAIGAGAAVLAAGLVAG